MTRLAREWRALPVTSRVGLLIVLTLTAMAALAPWLAPYDPSERVTRPFATPSLHHLLGADDVGHDLLSVLIHGARPSLLVGFIAAVVATGIGMAVGITAGYLRGPVDTILMRIVDVVMSLPVVPLTLVVGVALGPGLTTQVFVISIALWAPMARELRSQVLSLRERDHVHALRAMGARSGYVLTRHIVPAVAVLVVPQLVLAVKSAVLLEASLAFLGLGDVTVMSWGMMLSVAGERNAFLTDAWLWWILPPGALIALTVLGFALAGGAVERTAAVALRRTKPAVHAPHAPTADAPLLRIVDLTVRYDNGPTRTGGCTDVSLTLPRGSSIGLVGESGSGKSTVAAAVVGLMSSAAHLVSGRIELDGVDLTTLTVAERRALLGTRIALVPQEAQSALNPVHRAGAQIVEAVLAHGNPSAAEARLRAHDVLRLVGLPPSVYRAYPHELSGGQRQRVVIAVALANDPDVLVADEPTSGLDVLVQHDILALLEDLRARLGLTLLIVSHDLPVVARVADQIVVMQGGTVVEHGDIDQVLLNPAHPYTRQLLGSVPDLSAFEGVIR